MYTVTATQLNLRSTPEAKTDLSNRIAVLPNGQKVDKLEEFSNVWWKVSTFLQGQEFIGYVSSSYLSQDTKAQTANKVTEVHLSKNNSNSKRNSKFALAFPLGEASMPSRDSSNKVNSIKTILDWLNVEQSLRYRAGGGSTYCNIYAYDFCFLNGVYLPRVWWTTGAILRLSNNENVPVLYGDTVLERNANSLFDWFVNWSNRFGWERVNTFSALQERANLGEICILVAKRRDLNRSGHIVAVVPEDDIRKAKRDSNGAVIVPLQSQAGASNNKYFSGNKWWAARENNLPKFSDFALFAHS